MTRTPDNRAALLAAICAAAMIANQVAGKAARDAMFLANFSITDLPLMLVVAALASIITVLATSRAMARLGPLRLVRVAFAVSALIFAAEYVLIGREPRAAAVLLYLQMAVFGAVLISGFWSVVNERFDPHSAKRRVSRIAAGGTLGGLFGGIAAERVAATTTIDLILPVLAFLHAACAGLIWQLRDSDTKAGSDALASNVAAPSGVAVLRQTPYLRDLAALVMLTTVATAALDYVFKAQATAHYARSEDLLRFFAVFYTATALVTFVVQSTASRAALEKLGLGGTLATLPGAIAVGAGVAVVLPGVPALSIGRGVESTLRSSLFRSAYELMYTPLTAGEKRTTKTIIDVGFDRAGDAIGGGLIRLVLFLLPAAALDILLFSAIALGALCVVFANRLRRGYVRSLERSLLSRARELEVGEIADATTRSTILQTLGTLDLRELQLRSDAGPGSTARATREVNSSTLPPHVDPLLARFTDLRSGDASRVLPAIVMAPVDATLVPHLIPLLAWQEVCEQAVQALRAVADRHAGQLVDALLDQDQEFAVRRRVPRALAAASTQIAVDGLMAALRDKRFEVRFQAGRALVRITGRNRDLRIDRSQVFDAILSEVQVDGRVWQSRRLLDQLDSAEDELFDELVRQRSNRSIEHVFSVLSLILPREPLRIAYKGLHTDDKQLRGTALEYLESVLPREIRDPLWPFLDAEAQPSGLGKAREELLESLMRSNDSIELNLNQLRERLVQQVDGKVIDEADSSAV